MTEIIDEILHMKPYSLKSNEKEDIFLKSVMQSLQYHYTNCEDYKKYCMNKKFDPYGQYDLESIPFLPVSIFKKLNLLSVPENEIVRTVRSSSTTGNLPSVIHLDKTTIRRQMLALNSIMQDFLGGDKLDFLIIDNRKTIDTDHHNLSSRGSAIRGMLIFAKKFNCVLNDKLELDYDLLKNAVDNMDTNNSCIFGFTWLIHQMISKHEDDKKIKQLLDKLQNPTILHIGGWKKLKDISIDKKQFNEKVSNFFHTLQNHVIDFYGMTEQLGTVYPDCQEGYKHVPLYSEILIRDIHEQKVLPIGKSGFIQLISPLPRSYPGISLLTDDIGEIIGKDDCSCGRKGKYFVFKNRSEVADPKGCGDTLAV